MKKQDDYILYYIHLTIVCKMKLVSSGKNKNKK